MLANAKKKQLGLYVDSPLYNQFVKKCKQKKVLISSTIRDLMKLWTDDKVVIRKNV